MIARTELFSPSFSRLTRILTVSKCAKIENLDVPVAHCPYESRTPWSKLSASDFSIFICAVNPRKSPYFDGEKCAWSDDTLI